MSFHANIEAAHRLATEVKDQRLLPITQQEFHGPDGAPNPLIEHIPAPRNRILLPSRSKDPYSEEYRDGLAALALAAVILAILCLVTFVYLSISEPIRV